MSNLIKRQSQMELFLLFFMRYPEKAGLAGSTGESLGF